MLTRVRAVKTRSTPLNPVEFAQKPPLPFLTKDVAYRHIDTKFVGGNRNVPIIEGTHVIELVCHGEADPEGGALRSGCRCVNYDLADDQRDRKR